MSDSSGDERHLHAHLVAPDVMERLSAEHTDARPGIPFAWMLSYRAAGALQNIRYFENGVRHCKLTFPIRVFLSEWASAIVVSFVPVEAINEPHVMEWLDSFHEVPLDEAKARLTHYPEFPYNGTNPDTHLAELRTSNEQRAILRRSKERLRALGVRS